MMPVLSNSSLSASKLRLLQAAFGARLQQNVPLAGYTACRVGGPADYLLAVETADELAETAHKLWESETPFIVLGGGSNVLINDRGVRGVVLLNRARRVQFVNETNSTLVWAESGANLGLIARQAAAHGFSGLEWAAGIPGTLGGAVVGNAGAHDGDIAGNLILAEILHQYPSEAHNQPVAVREKWTVEQMEYAYRSSLLKRNPGQFVVLAAELRLDKPGPDQTAEIQERMIKYKEHRRRTQPPGASMGSMFKNPAGDFAGRLIDAAGLKGARIGDAQISALHANFFINHGQATAQDILALLDTARSQVRAKFSVELELEIELVGDWND
jgi:UDP-N-acetylmuramate dehydrogenase